MEVLHAHCAGLDLHKGSVVGCVRHMEDGKVRTEVKTFRTTTQELMTLSDWLSGEGVTHMAMEATGVYWKPVWHILSDGGLQATPAELEASLRGRVTAHHRFLLRLHLDQLDALNAAIARIDQEVDGNVEPFRVAIEMLATIPGVSNLSAEVIVSEIGIDMSRFHTEGNLISWAGLCSKNDESAGKRRSRRMKKGAPWLKTTLIQCAWAATRTKGTYLHAQYLRLRSRRGPKIAIGGVAASILTAAYHMLKNGTLYQDLGADHFDNRAKGKQVLRLLNRLRNLGFAVQITPVAA